MGFSTFWRPFLQPGSYQSRRLGTPPRFLMMASTTLFRDAIQEVANATNAIESLNYSLRKIVKGRGAFPSDEAIRKLLYLGLREASVKRQRFGTETTRIWH